MQRDYLEWHRAYDDPTSNLSWRLERVRNHLRDALDRHPGPLRIVSSCAGDGRDVLGVLSEREDADRVSVTLVEAHPVIAQQARERASAAGLSRVEVRVDDAGRSDAFAAAVPADVVLLVGLLGNISDADLARTIAAAPQLCAPEATLLWSRGRELSDRNAQIRAQFTRAGFAELDYLEHDHARGPALGALRYTGEPRALVPGQHWFTFLR